MQMHDDGVVGVQGLFAQWGLPLPAIPPDLMAQMRPVHEWLYATRDLPADPYDMRAYLLEVGTGQAPEYAVLGQAGHGVQSYFLHYYLVHGPLALFLRCSWGGAYANREDDARYITRRFAEADALAAAVPALGLAAGERLVVSDDDTTGASWLLLATPTDAGRFVAEGWLSDDRGLTAALEWVRKQAALRSA
jgi:hypothetical protein